MLGQRLTCQPYVISPYQYQYASNGKYKMLDQKTTMACKYQNKDINSDISCIPWELDNKGIIATLGNISWWIFLQIRGSFH